MWQLMAVSAVISAYGTYQEGKAKAEQSRIEAQRQAEYAAEQKRRADINNAAQEYKARSQISGQEYKLTRSGGFGASFTEMAQQFSQLAENVVRAKDMADYDFAMGMQKGGDMQNTAAQQDRASLWNTGASLLGGATRVGMYQKQYGTTSSSD